MTEPQSHLDRQLAKACEDVGKAFSAFGAALATLVHQVSEASRSELTRPVIPIADYPDPTPERPVIPIADLNQEQLSELVGKMVDIVGTSEASKGQGIIGVKVLSASTGPEVVPNAERERTVFIEVDPVGSDIGSYTYYGTPPDHAFQWGVRLHRAT